MDKRPGDVILTAVLIAVLFLIIVVLAPRAFGADREPDAQFPNSPESNQPDYWGGDCIKIDEGGSTSWAADADYDLVVLKAGTVDYVWYDVSAGDVLLVPKDISHFVLCGKVTQPTTTTTGATTSTSSTTTSTSTAPTTTVSVPSTSTVSPTSLASTTTAPVPTSSSPTTTVALTLPSTS